MYGIIVFYAVSDDGNLNDTEGLGRNVNRKWCEFQAKNEFGCNCFLHCGQLARGNLPPRTPRTMAAQMARDQVVEMEKD